jgi:hypothetical protein
MRTAPPRIIAAIPGAQIGAAVSNRRGALWKASLHSTRLPKARKPEQTVGKRGAAENSYQPCRLGSPRANRRFGKTGRPARSTRRSLLLRFFPLLGRGRFTAHFRQRLPQHLDKIWRPMHLVASVEARRIPQRRHTARCPVCLTGKISPLPKIGDCWRFDSPLNNNPRR